MFIKKMAALALMFLVVSNVMRVEAAPANNLTPEQIEAIVRNMYDKFTAFDAQGPTDCFAPDGTIEDSVGNTPIQGTAAILAYQVYIRRMAKRKITVYKYTVKMIFEANAVFKAKPQTTKQPKQRLCLINADLRPFDPKSILTEPYL